MAASLKIGRVGTDVAITDISRSRSRSTQRGQILTLTGWITSSSKANVDAVRTELLAQSRLSNMPIAVTYNVDSAIDGFYYSRNVNIPLRVDQNPFGLFRYPFTIDLEYLGDHSSVEFLSNYTGLLIANDHGLTVGECQFFHAPPVAGDDAYTAGGGTSAVARTGEDGAQPVFLDVPISSGIGAARWGCAPSEYYDGAAKIEVSGYIRAGKTAPNNPGNFVISNGIIEIRGENGSGTSQGDISIRGYNGSWGSWIPFDIVWNSSADIPEWHMFSIIRNDPECVIVQLVRDADEAPPTDNRHWLTLNLRRGSAFVSCYYTYSTSVALTVDRAAVDAGTAITPTGASSAMAVSDAADDGDSNRWIVAGADVSATDTTNGGIDMASAAGHAFMLGMIIGGSGADSDDDGESLCRQWLAQLNESVQTVLR